MDINNITIKNVGGVDSRDYPDFCDAFIEEAEWKDTGKSLSETELETLTEEFPEVVNEYAHGASIGEAEYRAELIE